jgi:hypothetical protein
MAGMQALLSPGSLVTVAGAALSVIGWIGYASGNPNLSLPTIFYGIPILLGGLALKSSELAPAQRLTPAAALRSLREQPESEPLRKLVADVLRWRYGQKAHLESSGMRTAHPSWRAWRSSTAAAPMAFACSSPRAGYRSGSGRNGRSAWAVSSDPA